MHDITPARTGRLAPPRPTMPQPTTAAPISRPPLPSQWVHLADLLTHPSPHPGSYLLGASDLPILINPQRNRIVLAAASRNSAGLLGLALTAAGTATNLTGNETSVMAVTKRPDTWERYGIEYFSDPGFFISNIGVTKAWPGKKKRNLLIILDDIHDKEPEWNISADMLLDLAEEPGISILATGTPDTLTPLAHSIQSARLVVGNLHDSTILGAIPPLTTRLAANEFAVRHKSKWHIFSTVMPTQEVYS